MNKSAENTDLKNMVPWANVPNANVSFTQEIKWTVNIATARQSRRRSIVRKGKPRIRMHDSNWCLNSVAGGRMVAHLRQKEPTGGFCGADSVARRCAGYAGVPRRVIGS